jgi:hypothetical protein
MLIDLIDQPTQLCPDSPVVGSLDSNIPTSGDVHLYVHPNLNTHESKKLPTVTLYADSEGFDGGEIPPRSAQLNADPSASKRKLLGKPRTRNIRWSGPQAPPEKRKREFAVTQLYPRLLYTFSDVVVFVLRNARYATGGAGPLLFNIDF